MTEQTEQTEKPKRKSKIGTFFKRLFTVNIVYKLSALFLGAVLWLVTGYLL